MIDMCTTGMGGSFSVFNMLQQSNNWNLTSKAILHRKVLRWVDQVKEQGRLTWVGTLGENGERRGVGIPLKDDNLVHGAQHQATEVNDNGSKCVVDAHYTQQQQHSLLSQASCVVDAQYTVCD